MLYKLHMIRINACIEIDIGVEFYRPSGVRPGVQGVKVGGVSGPGSWGAERRPHLVLGHPVCIAVNRVKETVTWRTRNEFCTVWNSAR
jgi:hypothetical protein